jgi:hypothetical protein
MKMDYLPYVFTHPWRESTSPPLDPMDPLREAIG